MPLWVNLAIISTHTGSRTHDPRFSGLRFISLGRGLARHCAEDMSVLKACVLCLAGSCTTYSTSAFCWSLLNKCLIEKCNIIGLLVDTLFLIKKAFMTSFYFIFFTLLLCSFFVATDPSNLLAFATLSNMISESEHSTYACSHLAFRMLSAVSRV